METIPLREARRRSALDRHKALQPLIISLHKRMRAAFYAQGEIVLRNLAAYQGDFAAQKAKERTHSVVESSHRNIPNIPRNIPLLAREALAPGAWQKLLAAALFDSSDLFLAPLKAHIWEALVVGRISAMDELPVGISLDLANPRAVAYARNHAADMVSRINETTREALNRIIVQATDEGWSYSQAAKAIDTQFRQWAVYPQGEARAKMIAVTEMGNAYAEANLIVGQALKAEGLEIEKLWSTMQDERVSDLCSRNQAEGWIPVDQPFPSGDMRPLGHPRCRCDLMQRLKREGREEPPEGKILRRPEADLAKLAKAGRFEVGG